MVAPLLLFCRVTNGGKTSLTNKLIKAFPNCCVVHQDDFYKVSFSKKILISGFSFFQAPSPTPRPIVMLPSAYLCKCFSDTVLLLSAVLYSEAPIIVGINVQNHLQYMKIHEVAIMCFIYIILPFPHYLTHLNLFTL